MLRITARHAEEWNTWGHPDSAGERLRAMHAACERVGRDPATLHTPVQVYTSAMTLRQTQRHSKVLSAPAPLPAEPTNSSEYSTNVATLALTSSSCPIG